jgi:hypothetical protein
MKSLTWLFSGVFLLVSVSVAGAQCPGVQITYFRVTSAPFSADYVQTSESVNRDGSRRYKETPGRIYRDSEGRARCEAKNPKTGGIRFAIIKDPVAGLFIVMHPEKLTATVTHDDRISSQQNPRAKTDVNIRPADNTHTEEELPGRVIEGFTVTGKRSINTTGEGQTSTAEQWYSPDLKFELLYTLNNTYGNIAEKVINIRAGDPDASVFQVPEGYTVNNRYCRGNVCNWDSSGPPSHP